MLVSYYKRKKKLFKSSEKEEEFPLQFHFLFFSEERELFVFGDIKKKNICNNSFFVGF